MTSTDITFRAARPRSTMQASRVIDGQKSYTIKVLFETIGSKEFNRIRILR